MTKPFFPPVTGDALDAFPVMRAISARPDLAVAQPMHGLGAILLLHLRRSAAATVEVLIRLGMDPKDMLCIGKDYRYPDRGDTEARLRDLGIATSSIANLREALAGFSVRGDKPFIVLEDGGHVATEVYRDAALLARCRGIVEQTTKGDWRVRDAVTEFRVPHLSLPRSVIKREFECDSVGQAVQSSITALVAGHADLRGLKVGALARSGCGRRACARRRWPPALDLAGVGVATL